jgi:hypothetical protein
MNGHIRQRSPGSYELRYRANGKTETTSFRGGKRDAERELRRLLSLVDSNQHPNDPDRLTVSQWLARWLDMVRPEVARRSWRQYESGVRVHITPAIGHILLTKLTSADVQGFYSGLAATRLKASSRKQLCLLLTNSLNRACELRLISTSPSLSLKKRLPKIEATAEMRILDRHQCGELLAQAARRRFLPADPGRACHRDAAIGNSSAPVGQRRFDERVGPGKRVNRANRRGESVESAEERQEPDRDLASDRGRRAAPCQGRAG